MEYVEQLEYVTQEVLKAFCNLPSDVVATGTAVDVGDGWLRFTIRFEGAYDGELALECPPSFATTATARALGTSAGALTDAEVADVLAEFLNIAAGNLKAVLPRPTTFGFPRAGAPALAPGSTPVAETVVESAGEPIRLTLYRRSAAA